MANLLNADLAAALRLALPVVKRIPESNVTFTACNPLLSVICSTCAPSICFASAAALSIFLPMRAPVPAPTAVPIAAPIAAPLPLPITPPRIAPNAAPEPPPIAAPLPVLFILAHPLNIMVILIKRTINFILFIMLMF